MPRNLFGGNKAKKGKNYKFRNTELIFRESDDYAYAQVVNNLGNGLLNLIILNEKGFVSTALGHIRGKIRKVKFNKDDIVLIGFRDFVKTYKSILNVDVLYKYSEDHKNRLVSLHEISIYHDEFSGLYNQDDFVVFENENNFNDNESNSDSNGESNNLLEEESNSCSEEIDIDQI